MPHFDLWDRRWHWPYCILHPVDAYPKRVYALAQYSFLASALCVLGPVHCKQTLVPSSLIVHRPKTSFQLSPRPTCTSTTQFKLPPSAPFHIYIENNASYCLSPSQLKIMHITPSPASAFLIVNSCCPCSSLSPVFSSSTSYHAIKSPFFIQLDTIRSGERRKPILIIIYRYS
jgi:hypothetical protein